MLAVGQARGPQDGFSAADAGNRGFAVVDERVFLEANPGGQYAWIADALGAPITAVLADLITGSLRSSSARSADAEMT